jgi:transcriptional regulator with XRE-family HTH domain
MIKRNVMKPLGEGPDAGACGGPLWAAVGRRLHRRRIELGFSADRVAEWTGVPAESYEGFENGAPIPASLLAQVADLFETPVVWFFHGVADEEEPETETGSDAEPAVYRVATVEHRVQALAESFRKLDLEGQQHLLAISKALCRPRANAPRG